MDTAKLSSKGQVTIPIGIRRKLGLRTGENVVFIERSGIVSIASERGIGITAPRGWPKEYVEQVMHFGETPDPTFYEQPELPYTDREGLFD